MDLQRGATEREIRVRFRKLSRIYHPDRHKCDETGLTDQQAKEKFQEINNAYSYLCENF
jgi:curved DNA-binding protein CbpA